MDAILQRKLAGLGEYENPKALLGKILPTVEAILKQTDQAKFLTDRQKKKYLEKYQAAFLAFMVGQSVGSRATVTVCTEEDDDFDCVIKAIEPDGKTVFRPFQLKQLPSHQVNQHVEIQTEVDKLKKYSSDLAVAFWINRDIKIELSQLRLAGLKIQQLWFFGDSQTGEVSLHGGNIRKLMSGLCFVGVMRNGKLRKRLQRFKPCEQIETN